jgi:hypothetical protein
MNRRWESCPLIALLATIVLYGGAAFGAEDRTRFVRVANDELGQPRALQVAIVTYGPQKGAASDFSVDLIGAVHIGDLTYYKSLNTLFADYDALLFEMIATSERAIPQEDVERTGFISNTQLAMKEALGLTFQLDEIDYSKPNFVHADLSSQELSDSMDERNESLYVYFWRVFYASMEEYANDPLGLNSWEMLAAMVKPDSENALKITFAREMANAKFVGGILEGENGSAIIDARNERAIEVLRRELDRGSTQLGIFYGVAHMPDFEERLVGELGLELRSVAWMDAWDLREPDGLKNPKSN